MRYKEAFSGGQFGIKAAVTTEAVTAAAALHFKRPVRFIPSLEESITMTSKRHAYKLNIKLAADAGGHITACTNDFTVDKGAYTLMGASAMMRTIYMMQGPYYFPNIKALGRTVYTNNAFGGAARGRGPAAIHLCHRIGGGHAGSENGYRPV